PARTRGPRRGGGRRHRLPLRGRGQLHHRSDAPRKRRDVCLSRSVDTAIHAVQKSGARALRRCKGSLYGLLGGRFFSGRHTMAEGRDITAEVKRIIKEQLDVDEKDIKSEATFIDDLGADSLGLVELVLAFEEAFEIDIP